MTPKTVLVPLDGSGYAARAVPIASVLAERFDADVVLLVVQLPGGLTAVAIDDVRALGLAQGMRTELVTGMSVPDALRTVARDTIEPVICMATHARPGSTRAVLGSVAEDVVRALEIPAVLVGPRCNTSWHGDGPLLVCLDGSETSEAIIPVAHQWALALGTDVVLVHVFHPLDVETATAPEAVVGPAAERLAADVDVEMRVVRGRAPADTIVGLVDELAPAFVALATHGRTGLARVALGSVAAKVVHRSVVPALVVRPRLPVEPKEKEPKEKEGEER
jgi:nucleotide-binding universal stress UspA family protein